MANDDIPTAVEWSEIYDLGLAEIDGQHKALFKLSNEVAQAINQCASPDAIAAILGRLEHYSIRHFCAEEALMRRIAYPNFDVHRRAHLEFIRHLAEKRERQAAGGAIGEDLSQFLCDWLIEHILTADRGYAEHYERLHTPDSLLAGLFSFG